MRRTLPPSLQELVELGVRGTAFRVAWELRGRAGLGARVVPSTPSPPSGWTQRLPFPSAAAVAEAVADRVPADARAGLIRVAEDATRGRILAFGRHVFDYGQPVDWYLNPSSGERWTPELPWSRALQEEPRAGDVKLAWEIARFPHAYHIARAAAFAPDRAEPLGAALMAQMRAFETAAPIGQGIHWNSGQEVALRLLAWAFAVDALRLGRSDAGFERWLGEALWHGAAYVEAHIGFARWAIYNNHLIGEALLLYAAGLLLGDDEAPRRWRRLGRSILEAEAERQFYPDGSYIQQSHNYQRVALQYLVWATLLARRLDDGPPESWTAAIGRSVDFLVAHQNPSDGRLPNYGFNDGALPSIWSCCDYSDFRPTLQAASVLARGERLYDPGPWDEEVAWVAGPEALDAPLRRPRRMSARFAATGHHVLRGDDEGSFATFRCGTIRDRFSQIDMLHVDLWWRGQNLLVDAGSFHYNGDDAQNAHFMGTASHNTVMVDGHDQMLHYRRFKTLYWTRARLLAFEPGDGQVLAAGEHYGFQRHPGEAVHRRSVLLVGDDLWVVVDHVFGSGSHEVRLHWLAGPYPWAYEGETLTLDTAHGPFGVAVYDGLGQPIAGDVVAGRPTPPRGWLSRYYADKVPCPSLEVLVHGPLPATLVTVIGPGRPTLARDGEALVAAAGGRTARFTIRDGLLRPEPA